jgi:hypothetical protein
MFIFAGTRDAYSEDRSGYVSLSINSTLRPRYQVPPLPLHPLNWFLLPGFFFSGPKDPDRSTPTTSPQPNPPPPQNSNPYPPSIPQTYNSQSHSFQKLSSTSVKYKSYKVFDLLPPIESNDSLLQFLGIGYPSSRFFWWLMWGFRESFSRMIFLWRLWIGSARG